MRFGSVCSGIEAAMVGGKHKTAIRNATPHPFRNELIAMARKAHNVELSGACTAGPNGADARRRPLE